MRARCRASRTGLLGSHEIYGHEEREAEQSVNFVTCHDGFTLNDLVSYNSKHNEANGEDNRDGANDNRSWNCGVEGPTDDPEVEPLRNRQVKNFSDGHADVAGHPDDSDGRRGPAHAARQQQRVLPGQRDQLVRLVAADKRADLHRFVKLLIARRLLRDIGPNTADDTERADQPGIQGWHGVKLDQPDWSDHSHSLALSAELPDEATRVHLIFNAYWEPLEFELPTIANSHEHPWRRWIDTYLMAPDDIVPWQDAPVVSEPAYRAGPRSVAVLWELSVGPAPKPGNRRRETKPAERFLPRLRF